MPDTPLPDAEPVAPVPQPASEPPGSPHPSAAEDVTAASAAADAAPVDPVVASEPLNAAADITTAAAATPAATTPAVTNPEATTAEATTAAAAPVDEEPKPAPAIPELPPAECAARLATLFPALFSAGQPRPLKLRIQADIQQRAPGQFTRKTLSIFLHRHTTTTAYLKALVAAAQRVDLDGADAGELNDEHRQAAVEELERRRAMHDARRAAEREAQRKSRAQAPGDDRAAAEGPGTAPAPQGPRPERKPPALRQSMDQGTGPGTGRGEQGGRRDGAGPRQAAQRPRDETAGPQAPRRDPGRDRPRPDARGPDRPRPDARGPDRPRPDARGPQGRPGGPGQGPGAMRHGGGQPNGPRPPQVSQAPQADSRLPEDEGARSRLLLLRAFESTTLTRANFCALKGMKEADLEAQLVQARSELTQRAQAQKAQAKAQRRAEATAPPLQADKTD